MSLLDDNALNLLNEAVRTLFIVSIPTTAAAIIAAILLSFLQSIFSLHESGIIYVAKLFAVTAALILLSGPLIASLISLTQLAIIGSIGSR